MKLQDGEYYVVAFDEGTFYEGFSFSNDQKTNDINKAMLYTFDWQIPKDLYLQLYLEQENIKHYDVLKVSTKRIVEVID